MNAKPKIAVQLYSVHRYTDSVGLAKTLADVAKIGYKGVEWFVVECERHFDSLEAITPSFAFLSKAMFER